MSDELLNCPFCLSGLVFRIEKSVIGDAVHCDSCGALVPYKRWQTRPLEETLQNKEIHKLRAILAKLMYAMDKAREGKVDLDWFNAVWNECTQALEAK